MNWTKTYGDMKNGSLIQDRGSKNISTQSNSFKVLYKTKSAYKQQREVKDSYGDQHRFPGKLEHAENMSTPVTRHHSHC
jgi:hypothetical protein